MHPDLISFIRQYVGVVAAALLPVVLTAFVSMPLSLGAHPGEAQTAQAAVERHLC